MGFGRSHGCGQRPQLAANVQNKWPTFTACGQRSQGCGQRSKPATSIQDPQQSTAPAAASTDAAWHAWMLPWASSRVIGRCQEHDLGQVPGPGGIPRGHPRAVPRDIRHAPGPPGADPQDLRAFIGLGPKLFCRHSWDSRYALAMDRARFGAMCGLGACLGHASEPFCGCSLGLGGMP